MIINKKKRNIIISVILAIILLIASIYGLLYYLAERHRENSQEVLAEVDSSYTGYKSFSNQNFNNEVSKNSNYTIKTNNDIAGDILGSYTTSLKNFESTSTQIEILESLNSIGAIYENIKINGNIVSTILYEDEFVSEINCDYRQISYEYENGRIYSFNNNGEISYYEYTNNLLTSITKNDEIVAIFKYNEFNKLVEEKYPTYGKIYEHTNIATIEYQYDSATETKIIAKIYDYLNMSPYKITRTEIDNQGTKYNVVSKVEYDGKTIEFEYEYFYNNTPYITHVKENDNDIYLGYLNDRVILKIENGYKYSYLYSNQGEIVGVLVGRYNESENEYAEKLVSLTRDPFNNIIDAKYLDYQGSDKNLTYSEEYIFQQEFNSYGQKIYNINYLPEINIGLGYKSSIEFAEFGICYKDGNLFSTLTGDYLLKLEADNYITRKFVEEKESRQNPLYLTVLKAIVGEAVQTEFLNSLDLSSISGMPLYNDGKQVGISSIYTLPAYIDENNVLKGDSQLYLVASEQDEKDLQSAQNLLKLAFENEIQSFVYIDGFYPCSKGNKSEINLQFIFLNKLVTVKYNSYSLITFNVKENYSRNDYLENKNVINYDTGRYVRYFQSTLNSNEYIENIALASDITSAESLNEFFNSIGVIDTSVGQSYMNLEFGDKTEYTRRVLENLYKLNIPEYDPDTQYISTDEEGNFIVKEIPEDAKSEFVKDEGMISAGRSRIINGLLMLLGVVLLIFSPVTGGASCAGGLVLICGLVATAAGAWQIVCGIAQVKKGLTGESHIIDDWFQNDMELFNTVLNWTAAVGSAALIIGGMAKTFCHCFTAGTQVKTPNGFVNIEDIKVGDEVVTYDEKNGEVTYGKVQQIYHNKVDLLYDIYYNNDCLSATAGHKFYVDGAWIDAENIKPGQKLTTSSGKVIVVEKVAKRAVDGIDVYNLNVNSTHTYFVGEDEVLTHNSCMQGTNIAGADKTQYVEKSLNNVVAEAQNKVLQSYAARGESTKGLIKWFKIRRDIWKEVGQMLKADKSSLASKILNFNDVIEKGKAPIMNINGSEVRIQLHHVVSKANDMFRVVPMTPQNHTLFHVRYGYHYNNPKLPWLMFDGGPRI